MSSEGQILLIAVNVYGIDPATALSITFWLHLGTALTVIIFYHRDILKPLYLQIRPPSTPTNNTKNPEPTLFGPLFIFVLIGTIATAITAVPLYFLLRSIIPSLFGEAITALIGVLLIITGVVLYFQRGRKGDLLLKDISLKEAFTLGLLQGLAVLPGISRSGMTLTWLLVRGVQRGEALRLSFILGVPSTFGVVFIDLFFGEVFLSLVSILLLLVLVALFTSLGTLALLRYSAMKIPWWIFCILLGAIVLTLTIPTIFSTYSTMFP